MVSFYFKNETILKQVKRNSTVPFIVLFNSSSEPARQFNKEAQVLIHK